MDKSIISQPGEIVYYNNTSEINLLVMTAYSEAWRSMPNNLTCTKKLLLHFPTVHSFNVFFGHLYKCSETGTIVRFVCAHTHTHKGVHKCKHTSH